MTSPRPAPPDFASVLGAWAHARPDVRGLVLIGSQVRGAADRAAGADAQSDWDFQLITRRPARYADRAWTRELPALGLQVYAHRRTFGGVRKVTAFFSSVEVDLVLVPALSLSLARLAVAAGLHRRAGATSLLRRRLADLAIVVRPGFRFLKGEAAWGAFYRRVVAEVADPRLRDAEVRALAESFVCDALWVAKKIRRGELLAAQRLLHQSLAETNFRLLHELRLRRGLRSFPEARRLELVAPEESAVVSVQSALEPAGLRRALTGSVATFERLTAALLNGDWQWPPDLERP